MKHKVTYLTVLLVAFSLMLVSGGAALAQGEGIPVSVGVPIEGEITAEQPEVLYTLEGSAGDVIAVTMTASRQGLDSFLELLLPDGSFAVSDDDSGGNLNSLIGPYTLPEDGTYTIRATRFGQSEGGSSGSFTLLVSQAAIQPLTPGEAVTVELNAAQPFAAFSFDGAQAGMLYELLAESQADTNATGFNIIVRDSAGLPQNQSYGQVGSVLVLGPLNLQPGEQYVMTIIRQSDGMTNMETASARLVLTLNELEAGTVALGDTVTGTLNNATPNAYYQFEAEEGQLLRLESSQAESGLALDVQIIAPSGTFVSGLNTAYDPYGVSHMDASMDPIVLNESGRHLLVVRMFDPQTGMSGAGDSTAGYTVTLGETQTPFLVPGEAQTAAVMLNGQGQTYRFIGTEGQHIRVSLAALDDVYTPALEVQGPGDPVLTQGHMTFLLNANSTLPGSASFELTLPKDGLYLFTVRAGGGYALEVPAQDIPGEYSLLLETLP